MRSGLEVKAEVVRPAALDEPVGEGRSAILDALAPVAPLLGNDAAVFRNDVSAGNEQDTVVGRHTALGEDDVAQLDECMAPVAGREIEVDECLEPAAVEDATHLFILLLAEHDLEAACLDETVDLSDGAGEMAVDLYVAVDIVEAKTGGILYIERLLPAGTPRVDLLPGERFGLSLYFGYDGLHAPGVSLLGEVKAAVGGVDGGQHGSRPPPEKVGDVHCRELLGVTRCSCCVAQSPM